MSPAVFQATALRDAGVGADIRPALEARAVPRTRAAAATSAQARLLMAGRGAGERGGGGPAMSHDVSLPPGGGSVRTGSGGPWGAGTHRGRNVPETPYKRCELSS